MVKLIDFEEIVFNKDGVEIVVVDLDPKGTKSVRVLTEALAQALRDYVIAEIVLLTNKVVLYIEEPFGD